MKIIELAIAVLAPDNCLGCDTVGLSLCEECRPTRLYPEMCHSCRKPSPGSLTCKKCTTTSPLAALYVYTALDSLPKDLVWKAKYTPSRSAAREMGQLAGLALPYLDKTPTIITHLPTVPSRIRTRAFDQAHEMARKIASQKDLPRTSLLQRLTYHHQVGAGRKERLEHMKGAFACAKPSFVRGKTIVLVDDVYTTGATLESAARVLKAAGAKRVVGLVFARAE